MMKLKVKKEDINENLYFELKEREHNNQVDLYINGVWTMCFSENGSIASNPDVVTYQNKPIESGNWLRFNKNGIKKGQSHDD